MVCCPLGGDQVLVQHPLQFRLQTTAVDGRAESFEILDGQLAVLDEVTQRLGLTLVQAMLVIAWVMRLVMVNIGAKLIILSIGHHVFG
jgi:hypothetical protein